MARNRGMYVDYGGRRGRRRRRGPSIGTVCGILIVVILAVIFGVLAYKVSQKNIGDLPVVPTATPVLGTPTPVPTPTPSLTPTPTPTPTPTHTPTPVPTSPETGLPCTPTPTPTPAWNHEYLVGWEDTRTKVNVKGAYVGLNLNSSKNVEKWLEMAKKTELNAVVIDVKADTGKITYQMDNAAIKELGICINQYTDMKGLLKTLKDNGIYTIARVVCFKDNTVGSLYPEYMLYKKDGTLFEDRDGEQWMNPYNRDTWAYIVDIAEQAALDGFDEICFDYIRFTTSRLIAKKLDSGKYDYNFEYNVEFGYDSDELNTRQIITAFTKYACNRLKPLGVFVSASVYGAVVRSGEDSARVGQDYVEMSRYVDYICPMIYPSHYGNDYGGLSVPDAEPYKLISLELGASQKKLEALKAQQDTYAECRPWLQAFTATWVKGYIKYTGPVIRKQVDAAYDTGHTSWFLWNSSASYPEGSFLDTH